MLTHDDALNMFKQAGAYLEGHFLLTSGLHSATYLEKFQILQHPAYTERLCREIADRFRNEQIEVVVGPATGGIILAYEVAKQLGVRGIFTEREGGRMALRRGFQIAPGERTLVVEDVVSTGGSVVEVVKLVQETGADLRGVGLLLDRSGGKVDLGVRTEPLLRLSIEAWSPEACPLCAKGIALTERGSRHLK